MDDTPLAATSASDPAMLRETLDDAVSELYTAFSKRKLSAGGPDACTACCASPEAMARIATGNQKDLSFDDVSEYLSAAKGGGAGEDLAFLLPRIMEFIAAGREPKCAGLFAVFSHYFPPMVSELTKAERSAVKTYGEALARWHMNLSPDDDCDFDLSGILEMYASGGLDIEAIVEPLAHPSPTPQATRALVDIIIHSANLWRTNSNGFYDIPKADAALISQRLRQALSSPDAIRLLEMAALSEDDPELAEQASLAHQIAEAMEQ